MTERYEEVSHPRCYSPLCLNERQSRQAEAKKKLESAVKIGGRWCCSS